MSVRGVVVERLRGAVLGSKGKVTLTNAEARELYSHLFDRPRCARTPGCVYEAHDVSGLPCRVEVEAETRPGLLCDECGVDLPQEVVDRVTAAEAEKAGQGQLALKGPVNDIERAARDLVDAIEGDNTYGGTYRVPAAFIAALRKACH